jgi:hypothetical protein
MDARRLATDETQTSLTARLSGGALVPGRPPHARGRGQQGPLLAALRRARGPPVSGQAAGPATGEWACGRAQGSLAAGEQAPSGGHAATPPGTSGLRGPGASLGLRRVRSGRGRGSRELGEGAQAASGSRGKIRTNRFFG